MIFVICPIGTGGFWISFGVFVWPWGSFWWLLEGLGGVREVNGKKDAFGGETPGIKGTLLGHLFVFVFLSAASGSQKRGSGSALKTRPLFWRISGSPRRVKMRLPSRRQLNFHFGRQAQKGLQNGDQHGVFWRPKSQLYSLWGAMGEKLMA